jgi:hypothetical protein
MAKHSLVHVVLGLYALSLGSLPNLVTEVKPTVDTLTIEMKSEVRSRDRETHGFGSKRSEANTALMAHASVDDAIRPRIAELSGQRLSRTVVVRIVDPAKSTSNVVKPCVDRSDQRPQLHRGSKRLSGSCKEESDMMSLFMHGGH